MRRSVDVITLTRATAATPHDRGLARQRRRSTSRTKAVASMSRLPQLHSFEGHYESGFGTLLRGHVWGTLWLSLGREVGVSLEKRRPGTHPRSRVGLGSGDTRPCQHEKAVQVVCAESNRGRHEPVAYQSDDRDQDACRAGYVEHWGPKYGHHMPAGRAPLSLEQERTIGSESSPHCWAIFGTYSADRGNGRTIGEGGGRARRRDCTAALRPSRQAATWRADVDIPVR